MRKSFRLHLFIRIVVATGLIILANRYIAQYHLSKQMEQSAFAEMARVLALCDQDMQDRTRWRSCTQRDQEGNVLHALINFIEPCQKGLDLPEARRARCEAGLASDIAWKSNPRLNAQILFGQIRLDGALWHVARHSDGPPGTQVMLADDAIWSFLATIWSLRDRNLIYVLPTVVLMLLGLTLFMVYVVMRPIRLMEETLSQLDLQNLKDKTDIPVPYREFSKLANVYRDLLKRLDQSYLNAKRFSSDAAHELRTPLSIMRGNIERLIPDTPTGSAVQMRVQNLGDEVDRLILITEKLLMLSRADSKSLQLDLEWYDLSMALEELIEDAESFHNPIRFITHIEPGVKFRCDKALIEQLINNLISNAIKYNARQNPWIELHLRQQQGQLILSLKNAAESIPPGLAEKAFERFYRGDDSRSRKGITGLGLGLSICKEIALVHQGSITLEVPSENSVSVEFKAPLNPTLK